MAPNTVSSASRIAASCVWQFSLRSITVKIGGGVWAPHHLPGQPTARTVSRSSSLLFVQTHPGVIAMTSTLHQWEYAFVSKPLDYLLIGGLNELGRDGWETISISYNKDLKGNWAWTAFLKTPAHRDRPVLPAKVESRRHIGRHPDAERRIGHVARL